MAWHEDDRFWQTFSPFLFSAKRWGQAPAEVDAVLTLSGVPPGASVLDLCCGTGRHALELARRGYRVTGVDRTGAYLDEARGRALADSLTLELVEDDMRNFAREASFDLALNLFTSFSFSSNPSDDRRVLGNLHRSVVPGGRLVMDLMGKEVLARVFRERDWLRLDDGSLFFEEREILGAWEGVRSRWTRILPDGEAHSETVELRLHGASELRRLLEEAGFAKICIFGSLDGRAYDHQAERLVAVATKPD